MGITVTKKVGNAVTRNRIKRFVREATRRYRWIPPDVDVVVIAKKHAAKIRQMGVVEGELRGTHERLSKISNRAQGRNARQVHLSDKNSDKNAGRR